MGNKALWRKAIGDAPGLERLAHRPVPCLDLGQDFNGGGKAAGKAQA